MPKIYEYLGILIFFYSNEHEPIHVHARKGENESKAEFVIENGKISEMKITEEPAVDYQITYSIIKAKLISDFKIKVTFSDGEKRTIDFEPFLLKSQHPSIKKYLNREEFKKFKIIHGNLNWNDYDMIFPLSDLRKGKIT